LEAFRFALNSRPSDCNSAIGRATLTSVLAGFVTLVLQPPLLLLEFLLLRPLPLRRFVKVAELRAVETTVPAFRAVIAIAVVGRQ
jgi:hypothetical protein